MTEPPSRDRRGVSTIPSAPPTDEPPRRLWLMVLGERGFASRFLPASGAVVIGRGEQCDVVIDDGSVSRRHAVLHLGGPAQIEDVGSANGTFQNGVRLAPNAPAPVRFGEVVHVGAVPVILQQHAPAAAAEPAAPPRVIVVEPAMRAVHDMIDRIADGDLSVLLLGETGVGKEVCAARVHDRSRRAAHPFVKLNCAALTESLLESELFGHEKGAFTGAVAAKPGLLASADKGTVFLDEVGELSPAIQAKLLRTLEDRVVMPVGGVRPRAIDVRFVAATNRDLEAEVAAGRFRRDLYYRLAGFALIVPPLRERVAEIEPLAAAFAAAAAGRMRWPTPALSADAVAWLRAQRWPGNVRELRNVVERGVLLARDCGVIGVEHLAGGPGRVGEVIDEGRPSPDPRSPAAVGNEWWRPDGAERERERIIAALEQARGNQTRAAALLGMSRRTLLNRLDALAVPRPRKRSPSEE